MDKIIAKDIVKTLKGKTVLNHVDLELEKGLVHGFFGRKPIRERRCCFAPFRG